MAVRPTVDDLVAWLRLQSTPSEDALALYGEAFDAAISIIEGRITLPDGALDEDSVTYPQEVRTAVLLQAARLAKRSTSPEGVAGLSDLGVAVRVLPADPDVERLLLRFLKLDGYY